MSAEKTPRAAGRGLLRHVLLASLCASAVHGAELPHVSKPPLRLRSASPPAHITYRGRPPNALLVSSTDLEGGVEAKPASDAPVAKGSVTTSLRRTLIAYLLWFLLPLFGAHHLYLGRHRDALLSSVSLGGFGLGWLCDVFRIPGYVRALGIEEQRAAAPGSAAASASSTSDTASSYEDPSEGNQRADAAASGASATSAGAALTAPPPPPMVRISADGSVHPAAAERLGLLSSVARLLFRVVHRLLLGYWCAFHLRRLLPDGAEDGGGLFLLGRSLVGTLVGRALYAALHVLPALVVVALTSERHAVTAGGADATAEEATTAAVAPQLPFVLADRRLLCHLLLAAAGEAALASAVPLRAGGVPLLVSVAATTLPSWRAPPRRDAPTRSIRSLGVVAGVALAFWVLVAIGSLRHLQVAVTVDGAARSMSGMALLRCSTCALRPDRFLTMLRTLQEHICVKRALEEALRTQFERFCVLPQQINRCLDWDVSGTRWQRVGLSLAEAYRVLGLRKGRSSVREVKAAYHKIALRNHPDKVAPAASAGGPGSAAAEEAAMEFMKAQKAFEKIMDHHKRRKPPPPPPRQRYDEPAPPPRPRRPRGGASPSSSSSSRKAGAGKSSRGTSSGGRTGTSRAR